MKIEEQREMIDDYFEKEEWSKSLELCKLLFNDHPAELTFDDQFKKGLCHFKLDENKDAVGCFESALEIDPESQVALTNKGICLYLMDRIPEAFCVFNKVLKLNPNVFPPWYYIGMYYLPKYAESADPKQLEIVVNAYRQVVRMAPDFGGFPVYDPVKKAEYPLDMFLLLHDEVKEISIDELTAL
jgi:tetratricopeptide (TPR) repeat protein